MIQLCKKSKYLFFLQLYFTFSTLVAAPKVSLSDIQLVGTIIGKQSLAIIRIQNQFEGIYQLNESISGYSIKSISKKSVLLEKHNETFSIALIAVKDRQFYGSDSSSNTKVIKKTYEYRINRNTFNSLHTKTQAWLDDVRMKMHIENGYFAGYLITSIRENSPAELLGLVEGDIIKGINGNLIKQDPEKFTQNISQLASSKYLILNMTHNEVDFNIKFFITD